MEAACPGEGAGVQPLPLLDRGWPGRSLPQEALPSPHVAKTLAASQPLLPIRLHAYKNFIFF